MSAIEKKALQAHHAGDLAKAAEYYQQILRAHPNNAQALHHLGLVLIQRGALEDGIKLVRRAIAVQPDNGEAHANLGLALCQHGEPAAAEAALRRAIALKQMRPQSRAPIDRDLATLGVALAMQGRHDDAIAAYREALALRPDAADIHANLGLALTASGRPAEAAAAYRRSIALNPHAPASHCNLGLALAAQGKFDDAIAAYRQSLALMPQAPQSWFHLGAALMAQGRAADAADAYAQASALDAGVAEFHSRLGMALAALGRLDDAIAAYGRAIALDPGTAEFHSNLGNALTQRGDAAAALEAHRRAVALKPDAAAMHANLAVALAEDGRVAAAIDAYREAIAVNPDYAPAHVALAMALLTNGTFAEGWREYEWRAREPSSAAAEIPQWTGETLAGKTLLLDAEQGLGDTLQFVRYVAPLASRGARIVLAVQPPLVTLLTQSLDGVAQVQAAGEGRVACDYHCPLMSLPFAFGTERETIPVEVPYLRAHAAHVAAWRDRLAPLPGLRVGLVWAGAPRAGVAQSDALDRRRSIALARFAPLAAIPGVSFVSLQKGEAAAQIHHPPAGMVIHDWTDELQDFAATAALVDALDLVISVDTSVLHLAGALAKPVWLLNRFAPCWRWLLTGDDSPWYPTLRQFRQRSAGDWDEVIARVADELAKHAV